MRHLKLKLALCSGLFILSANCYADQLIRCSLSYPGSLDQQGNIIVETDEINVVVTHSELALHLDIWNPGVNNLAEYSSGELELAKADGVDPTSQAKIVD